MVMLENVCLGLRPTRAEISLSAIAHNTTRLLQHRPDTRLCAVLKADAYGHGAIEVARATLSAGAHGVAVALVEEALTLRDAGIDAPIYILAGHYAQACDTVVQRHLTPVIGQPEDLFAINAAAKRAGRKVDVHLEVDTGMARLGWRQHDAVDMMKQAIACTWLRVVGLMTHLSHSDEPLAPSNGRQIAALDACIQMAKQLLPECLNNHVLNSGGLVSTAAGHPWGMVRCGLALYGIEPVPKNPIGKLRPALTWLTRPVSLRKLAKGDAVSYGSHWRAPRACVIATLPVGYADGYPRNMSNKAQVLVGGQQVPVVGTICMDLCMIDVTDVADVGLDSEVVLLGSQGTQTLCANTLAAWSGTIGYEILARIGPRVQKIYEERH